MAHGPGMRCVLEYLEANKRIHIIARSPVLRALEKWIPLHLEQLSFRDDTIQLNNISYEIKQEEEKVDWNEEEFRQQLNQGDLIPGDLIVIPADGTRIKTYGTITFANSTTKVSTTLRIPDGYETYFSAKILSTQLLGHKEIYANKMTFDLEDNQILRLPVNFQVRVNHLDTRGHELSDFEVLVHPDCVPLKSLAVTINSEENFGHFLFKTADKLIILDSEARISIERLQNLTNKHVIFENYQVSQTELRKLIEFWIRNRKPVGTIFESTSLGKSGNKQALEAFKKEFNGYVSQWREYDGRSSHRGITIPVSDTEELFICTPEGNFLETVNLAMRVLVRGASRLAQKRKLDHKESD